MRPSDGSFFFLYQEILELVSQRLRSSNELASYFLLEVKTIKYPTVVLDQVSNLLSYI